GIDGEQIFVLGADEVRAVDREQRLAAADVLISRIREHLFDPSGETRLHVALQPFVGLDVASGIEVIAYVLSHHGRELDSDQLPALRRDSDWRQWRIRSVCDWRREEEKGP